MDMLKVLIVDDDEDELVILEDALLGFQTLTADSSGTALALVQRNKFDVALVDVVLSGANSGFELAQKLKAVDPEMAIIIHTGIPETYIETTTGFDGYLLKGSDEHHLRSVLINAIHLKRLSVEERLRRDELYLLLEPDCKQNITDSHFQLTYNGPQGISERWLGRWRDGFPSAWVIYRLGHQSPNRFTIGLASTVGCGLGCRFCMSAQRPFERILKSQEMLGQFLLASNSGLAQVMFQRPEEAEVIVSHVCEGDPLRNIHNVMAAIRKLSEVRSPRIRSKLTSIGFEDQLRVYINRYIDMPVRHYWSVHSFRPEVRQWLMPATKQHNFYAVMDLYSQIANITGEAVTDNFSIMPGYNDGDEEVEAIVRKIGERPEHQIQILPFTGAPGFHPFITPSDDQLEDFQYRLVKKGFDPSRIEIHRIIGGGDYGGCGTTVPKYRDRASSGASCEEVR